MRQICGSSASQAYLRALCRRRLYVHGQPRGQLHAKSLIEMDSRYQHHHLPVPDTHKNQEASDAYAPPAGDVLPAAHRTPREANSPAGKSGPALDRRGGTNVCMYTLGEPQKTTSIWNANLQRVPRFGELGGRHSRMAGGKETQPPDDESWRGLNGPLVMVRSEILTWRCGGWKVLGLRLAASKPQTFPSERQGYSGGGWAKVGFCGGVKSGYSWNGAAFATT